jgi:hypothetical protein
MNPLNRVMKRQSFHRMPPGESVHPLLQVHAECTLFKTVTCDRYERCSCDLGDHPACEHFVGNGSCHFVSEQCPHLAIAPQKL